MITSPRCARPRAAVSVRCQSREVLALTWAVGYTGARMSFRRSPARPPAPGAVASQPVATLPQALATSRALVYARMCTGDDMTQPIRRIALQAYKPTSLQPRAASPSLTFTQLVKLGLASQASRSANYATVGRSAPVLTVAPIDPRRVSCHAAVRPPGDRVWRHLHESTPNRRCRQQEADGLRVLPPPRGGGRACRPFRRGARQMRHTIED